MILKGNIRKKRIKNPPRLVKEIDLSVDTGHMSHHSVPLPLKKDKKLTQAWDYLPKDDIPKQILRQKGLIKTNKKKLKHIKSHQKQEHEKQRSNQLFQQGIKINQTNGSY
jgi:hypothetical protein